MCNFKLPLSVQFGVGYLLPAEKQAPRLVHF
jgi:hypothetical protein